MLELVLEFFLVILELCQNWSWRKFLLLVAVMAGTVGALLLIWY